MATSERIKFIRESNRIENINSVRGFDTKAHELLWSLEYIKIEDVILFVRTVAGAPLRNEHGMNVVVGQHWPPPGGRRIERYLTDWLNGIQREGSGRLANPYDAHIEYESIHPFMDGNGRSGRALWAWQMMRLGKDPFEKPFLHLWYFATLDKLTG